MIEKAVAFAQRAHAGAVRKGTNIPYITHPIEAAVIVSLMTDDPELIAAALLHDVVEDAGVTAAELQAEFGQRVAELVMEESEDKSLSWEERKKTTVEHLSHASRAIKILTLGDKLSNIRSTAKDCLVIEDEIWQRFNVKDKDKHRWYYKSIMDALEEFGEHPCYQEYVLLYHKVFDEK